MKKLILVLVFISLTNVVSAQEGYLGGLVSALKKSHSAEAIGQLSVFKTNLLGCLMTNQGQEASCKSAVNFQSSSNFDYAFSKEPSNGSSAWAIKASGKGEFTSDDSVTLTSDESGVITCQGSGKMANSC